MDSTSNTSIVNGDASSSRAADPNEAQRLQYQRLQDFIKDADSPNLMLPHMTTSIKESTSKHKKKMSKKINNIMSMAQK
ncbi:hypothetical protein LY78DRAFT_684120 [Colletotrichum sublineola]|nr:hypothetical protein LY78DRAFT_684120 [Colletotrichum sublineola]